MEVQIGACRVLRNYFIIKGVHFKYIYKNCLENVFTLTRVM